MFEISSNLFALIAIDTLLVVVSLGIGYLAGRRGYTQIKADVEALKAIVYPNTTVAPTV